MSVSQADIDHSKELYADLPNLTTRRMMGGLCLYSDGTIFAIIHSDLGLMLKATKGPFAQKLATMGCTQWTYSREAGKTTAMPYWTLPPEALDDSEAACDLARQALAALED